VASVVVVGGGVAGLACAWQLCRAGHEVEVLERAPEAGGRMRSEQRGGYQLDRGAQFVASSYTQLHGLARAVGLAPRLRDLDPSGDAVCRAGKLHPVDTGAPWRLVSSSLLSTRGKAGLARFGLEIARRFRRLDPLHPERAAGLDQEDLASGLRRTAGPEASEWLLSPSFSATFDTEPEDLSYAFGLLALRLLARGARLQTFEGGVGTLTRALASKLSVRTGCEVFSIETETGGARVRYRTQRRPRTVLADAAVVALPGHQVPALCPKLTPDERGFLESVDYGRGIIVHLLLERSPSVLRNLYGISFPRGEGVGLYGLCADHHKAGAAPAGAGLLNAALRADVAARLWDAPDESIAQHVLEELLLTPVGRVSPCGFAVHRWDPLLPRFGPGYLPRLARFLRRIDRSPRLAFAGDYLVGPWAEGAVASGLRAAAEIQDVL